MLPSTALAPLAPVPLALLLACCCCTLCWGSESSEAVARAAVLRERLTGSSTCGTGEELTAGWWDSFTSWDLGLGADAETLALAGLRAAAAVAIMVFSMKAQRWFLLGAVQASKNNSTKTNGKPRKTQ